MFAMGKRASIAQTAALLNLKVSAESGLVLDKVELVLRALALVVTAMLLAALVISVCVATVLLLVASSRGALVSILVTVLVLLARRAISFLQLV